MANEVKRGKPKPFATQAERDIYKGLIEGLDIDEIANENGLTYDEVAKAHKAVMKRFRDKADYDIDEDKGLILARYDDLYRRALKLGNYKVCKSILDSEAEIKNIKQTSAVVDNNITLDWG